MDRCGKLVADLLMEEPDDPQLAQTVELEALGCFPVMDFDDACWIAVCGSKPEQGKKYSVDLARIAEPLVMFQDHALITVDHEGTVMACMEIFFSVPVRMQEPVGGFGDLSNYGTARALAGIEGRARLVSRPTSRCLEDSVVSDSHMKKMHELVLEAVAMMVVVDQVALATHGGREFIVRNVRYVHRAKS